MLNDKLILLNEMVISSGNENSTHFSVTYETEIISEHGLSHRTVMFDMLWTTSGLSACEKIQEAIQKLNCLPWISLSCIGLLNFDKSVYCDTISSMFRKILQSQLES